MPLSLRPYQTEARDELRAKYRAGARWLLLVLPTGSGKTVSAVDLIDAVVRRGKRVVFAAHRKVLIDQTSRKLDGAGLKDHGVMMADHWRARREAPVQLCSIQTLLQRNYFPPADFVVIDEAHYAMSKGYKTLKAAYPNAYGLGLSATPFRNDGQSLGDFFDGFVVGASISSLIEQGYLVPPRVFAPTTPDFRRLVSRGRGDFTEESMNAEMNRPTLTGNIVKHWLRLAPGKRTAVFACSVAHSLHLAARFKEAGVPAEHLDGSSTDAERTAILGRLETAETLVVTSCGVLSEGWDCPPTECLVLARPTQSLALYVQQGGRGLRPSPGKTDCLILDHAGNTLRHGFLTDEREIDFSAGVEPPERSSSGRSARLCPKCQRVMPLAAQRCDGCGYVFAAPAVLREGEGELQEVQGVPAKAPFEEQMLFWEDALKRGTKHAGTSRSLMGWASSQFSQKFGFRPITIGTRLVDPMRMSIGDKREFWKHLEQIRIERGYKPGWSKWQYRNRTGHYPRLEVMEAVA